MKMKKKLIGLLLLLCLVVTMIPVTDAQAAVKLNKTKISINVGKTYTLKVSGTTKKVTWSTNKKAVATVTSKGVVKGIKAGVAKITAKVNSKKYVCTVTVKKTTTTNYNSKVTYKLYEADSSMIGIFHNGNTCNVNISATVLFYDASGNILKESSDYTSVCQKGKDTVFQFYYPYDSNGAYADYSKYKLSYTVKAASTYYKSYVGKVSISSNAGSDGDIIAEVVNTGTKEIETIDMTCVFYKGDTVVGASTGICFDVAAGASDIETFYVPNDKNYDDVVYDSYKIYVNEAYTFDY